MQTRSPLRLFRPLLLSAALMAGLSGAASAQDPYPYTSYPRGTGPGTNFPNYVVRGDTEYFCRAAPVTLADGSSALSCRNFETFLGQRYSGNSVLGEYTGFTVGGVALLALIGLNGSGNSSGTGTN